MSVLGTGFENPAVDFGDEDGGDFDTAEKYELVRELNNYADANMLTNNYDGECD